MPSFADSAVIFILALMLFGPKKLPQLARQLGKLMAEFRRASNEFRMQMEDELRIEEQKEHQAKVDALAGPPASLPDPEQPQLQASGEADGIAEQPESRDESHPPAADMIPIAESGSLRMMPPSTGLPTERGAYTGRDADFTYHDADGHLEAGPSHTESTGNHTHHEVAEHTILPPAVGVSSEEPAEEIRQTEVHSA